jgi:hypothetical protein
MKRVVIAISAIAAGVAYGAHEVLDGVPEPIPTAVISEKPEKSVGGQAAILLPRDLNSKQAYLLNTAYKIAKDEGFKNPEVMQAILLQETEAGAMKSYKVANPGKDAYFGPMQIKLGAAKDVLLRHPTLYKKYDFHTQTDDEVKANLILNEKFNIEVATKYVKLLQTTYGLAGRALVNAYNRGPGGVKNVDDSFYYAIEGEKKLANYKRTVKYK